MDPSSRIGPDPADILIVAKGGRDFRYERLLRGEETPREFFYGYFDLVASGASAAMLSSASAAPGRLGQITDTIERGFAALTALGVRPLSMRLSQPLLSTARVVISYVDGFSLSLGLGYPQRQPRPVLIGGFHGLSDIESRAPAYVREVVRGLIRRSLAGLDHAFFFGPADREESIVRYGVSRERSSVIAFGVDTEFWRPFDEQPRDFVVAVGQDRNRDYDLLAAAPGGHPTRIVTRQPVVIPPGADHVKTTVGDFFGSDAISDQDLRRLYNAARAVVVPLKDVNQPTGYSVTLQAMACGRPVVLSRIRGLWAPEILRDGENCLLVPPGDAAALGAAIARIRDDEALAARLGQAARETARQHFGLDRIGQGTIVLADRGLSLHAQRQAAAA